LVVPGLPRGGHGHRDEHLDGRAETAELRDVSGVKSGQNYLLDLEMAVPGTWPVEHARAMEEAIRQRVGAKVRGAKRVRVRFVSQREPVGRKFDEFISTSPDLAENLEPEQDEDSSDDDRGKQHHDKSR
jgi:hypothetical protein